MLRVAGALGVDEVAGSVDRDSEPDADVAAARGQDRGVDADQVTVQIYERAARVAGVDRSIGLDEIVADTEAAAAGCADNAERCGLTEAEGVADRDDEIA